MVQKNWAAQQAFHLDSYIPTQLNALKRGGPVVVKARPAVGLAQARRWETRPVKYPLRWITPAWCSNSKS